MRFSLRSMSREVMTFKVFLRILMGLVLLSLKVSVLYLLTIVYRLIKRNLYFAMAFSVLILIEEPQYHFYIFRLSLCLCV